MTVRLILRQAQDDKAYATSPFGIVMAACRTIRVTTLLRIIFEIDYS